MMTVTPPRGTLLREAIDTCRGEFKEFEDYLFHNMAPDKERNRVLSCEVQRSRAWSVKRENLITASNFGVIAEQSEFSTCFSYWEYRIGKLHLQQGEEDDHGHHLRRGTLLEPLAIRSYALQLHHDTDSAVIESTGLWILRDGGRPFLGASPDGLLRHADGCVEVKCPARGPARAISSEHMCQIQGQLKICDRSFCDYVSFHARNGFRVWRVHRSEEFWKWV